jgi:uncharacterized membrane protein YjjP (DUF1212 family)
VEEVTEQVAAALGAEHIDLRLGYASLAITISVGSESITRMRKIGALGVNQRLGHALHTLGARIERGGCEISEAQALLDRIVSSSPHHPDWVVSVAVGIACAAFGRLLGVDWVAVGPIFAASVLAQMVRRQLGRRGVNVFLSTVVVAFLSSTLAGLGARWWGSQSVMRAMVVTVLLLVPGVPAFNAQLDILEGRPTLGSARAVWVAMILIFMTAGVWMAQGLLGEGR